MISTILTALLAGVCDAARGGKFHSLLPSWYKNPFTGKQLSLKIPSMITIALLYNFTIGWTLWGCMFALWLPALAQIIGTGNWMGKLVRGHEVYVNGEGWERFQFTDNAWVASAFVGFLWSLPCLGLALFVNPLWVVVSIMYTFSFPLAGIMSRKLIKPEDQWSSIEFLRSSCAMLLTNLAVF